MRQFSWSSAMSQGILVSLEGLPQMSLQRGGGCGGDWTAGSAPPYPRSIPLGPCPLNSSLLGSPAVRPVPPSTPHSACGGGLRGLGPHLTSYSVVRSELHVWCFWLPLGSSLSLHNQTWFLLCLSKLCLMRAWFGSQRWALDGFPLCLPAPNGPSSPSCNVGIPWID